MNTTSTPGPARIRACISRSTPSITLLVGILIIGALSACGDNGDTPTATTESITSSAPATSSAPTPTSQTPTLRPDGIGSVDFGTPAREGVAVLSGLLGPPDRVTNIDPDRDCVEGAPWKDCLGVVNRGRIVGWTTFGLEVALTDSFVSNGASETKIPPQVTAWRAVAPSSGHTLATATGLAPGATVADLEELHPEAEFAFNEGMYDTFYLGRLERQNRDPGIWGRLAFHGYDDYVRAIQRALNRQGATLEVDGVVGPATRTAWSLFCQAHALDCGSAASFIGPQSEEERAALEFPPPTVRIRDLHAG
jgi:hypothetical protein